MKFEISKKTFVIVMSCVAGLILLWGILSVVGHGSYNRDDFGRDFGTPGCGATMAQWAAMMSGMESIIANKDYAAFQTLFSGSRMLENINTAEKFATRVEIQTTMKKVQELQATLWSWNNGKFGPMMLGNTCWQDWKWMMGGENGRWNMMRRR